MVVKMAACLPLADLRPVKGGARAVRIKGRFLTLDRPVVGQGLTGVVRIKDRFLTGAARIKDRLLTRAALFKRAIGGGHVGGPRADYPLLG